MRAWAALAAVVLATLTIVACGAHPSPGSIADHIPKTDPDVDHASCVDGGKTAGGVRVFRCHVTYRRAIGPPLGGHTTTECYTDVTLDPDDLERELTCSLLSRAHGGHPK